MVHGSAAPQPRRFIARVVVALAVLGLAVGALNAWVYGDFKAPVLPPMEPVDGLTTLSATACSACHEQIYEEWKRSGHARAFTDPLYQAELQHQPAPFVCHRCHTPLVEQREELAWGMWLVLPTLVPATSDNDRFAPELQREGVTCVACHQVDGRMVGPFDDVTGAPHPTAVGELRAVDTCARCHQFGFERIGKLHRPIIDTVTEWEQYREAGGDERCADCHLPVVAPRPVAQVGPTPGPLRPGTDHSLRGPFDAEFVKTAVEVVDSALIVEGGHATASLSLLNRTGHRLPTAEPERSLQARLAARDETGRVLAEELVKAERRVDVVKLRELSEDTTVSPRGRLDAALELELPAGATTVELSLHLWLWDPEHEAARTAGLSATELAHSLWSRRVEVPR